MFDESCSENNARGNDRNEMEMSLARALSQEKEGVGFSS